MISLVTSFLNKVNSNPQTVSPSQIKSSSLPASEIKDSIHIRFGAARVSGAGGGGKKPPGSGKKSRGVGNGKIKKKKDETIPEGYSVRPHPTREGVHIERNNGVDRSIRLFQDPEHPNDQNAFVTRDASPTPPPQS